MCLPNVCYRGCILIFIENDENRRCTRFSQFARRRNYWFGRTVFVFGLAAAVFFASLLKTKRFFWPSVLFPHVFFIFVFMSGTSHNLTRARCVKRIARNSLPLTVKRWRDTLTARSSRRRRAASHFRVVLL